MYLLVLRQWAFKYTLNQVLLLMLGFVGGEGEK